MCFYGGLVCRQVCEAACRVFEPLEGFVQSECSASVLNPFEHKLDCCLRGSACLGLTEVGRRLRCRLRVGFDFRSTFVPGDRGQRSFDINGRESLSICESARNSQVT